MAIPGLPASPHRLVFREFVRILRADVTVGRACKVIKAWEGKGTDADPLTIAQAPCIRLTPIGHAPDQWQYPEAFSQTLPINIEVLVPGYDVGDMLDIWYAVKRAVYPKDHGKKLLNIEALRKAGAKTGMGLFSVQAAGDHPPESNLQAAIGQFKIDILEQLTT